MQSRRTPGKQEENRRRAGGEQGEHRTKHEENRRKTGGEQEKNRKRTGGVLHEFSVDCASYMTLLSI